MLHGVILLAHGVFRLLQIEAAGGSPGFRHQRLPEIVVKSEVQERAVHIQQEQPFFRKGHQVPPVIKIPYHYTVFPAI